MNKLLFAVPFACLLAGIVLAIQFTSGPVTPSVPANEAVVAKTTQQAPVTNEGILKGEWVQTAGSKYNRK